MADERIVRLAEIEIDPARLAEYRAALSEEIAASLALEPGVLMLNAAALKDAPAHIRIMEVYANRGAYEAHLTTPHFLKYKAGTASMVRSLKLIEMDAIAMNAAG